MISGETERVDPNLLSWIITKVTSKKIEIDLVFDKPLEVSQGDYPDKLAVQASLSQFADKNGKSLEPRLIRTKDIPRQISTAEEA